MKPPTGTQQIGHRLDLDEGVPGELGEREPVAAVENSQRGVLQGGDARGLEQVVEVVPYGELHVLHGVEHRRGSVVDRGARTPACPGTGVGELLVAGAIAAHSVDAGAHVRRRRVSRGWTPYRSR